MRGFTLLETLITTAILASGLTAVALMFSYTASANVNNQQRTTAALLLYEKLEEFRSSATFDPIWTSGGGLDPSVPVIGYSDRVVLGNSSYLRVWEIEDAPLKNVTLVVYAENAGLTRQRMELARSAVFAGSTF